MTMMTMPVKKRDKMFTKPMSMKICVQCAISNPCGVFPSRFICCVFHIFNFRYLAWNTKKQKINTKAWNYVCNVHFQIPGGSSLPSPMEMNHQIITFPFFPPLMWKTYKQIIKAWDTVTKFPNILANRFHWICQHFENTCAQHIS